MSCGEDPTAVGRQPTQVVFRHQPSDQRAGDPITRAVQVDVVDDAGLVVAEALTSVTVELGTNPGGATLFGTSTVAARGGRAVFDDLQIDKPGTGYTLLARATVTTGETTATSDPFSITPGLPADLVFSVQPSDAPAGDLLSPAVAVSVVDSLGNVATDAQLDITLDLTTSPLVAFASGAGSAPPAALNGTTTVSTTDGVATFSNLSIDAAATAYTLTAAGGGLTSAPSTSFTITPTAAVQVGFTTQPTDAITADPIPGFAVAFLDSLNNVVATETAAITIAFGANPSGAALSGTVTQNAVNGVATFADVSIDKPGPGYTLVATTGALPGATSDSLDIVPRAGVYVIVDPTDGIAGIPVTVRIEARDQFGNLAAFENRDVTIAGTGALTGGGLVNIVNGVGTIAVNDTLTETVTLSLIDSQGTGLDVTSTQDLAFSAGPVARFAVLDPIDGTVDDSIAITVQAQDRFGNLVATENRDVTLVVSDSATGGGLVDIQNGVGSANVNDREVETVTLTLTDSEGTGLDVGSTQDVTFGSGAAVRFAVADPADATVGTPVLVTVRALDQYDNVSTGENRDVTLLLTGAATGGGNINIVNGAGTRFIGDTRPETITLSLADTEVTGLDVTSTQDVQFFVDSVSQYVILDPTDGTVDAAITVTVQAQDQYGNIVPTENRDVTLVTSGSATGGGVVNIQSGTGSLNISDQVPETVTLSLQDTGTTGLDVTSTQDVVVDPGVAVAYVLLDPTDATVGTQVLVTIQAWDQYGNVAAGENRDVTLVSTGSTTGVGVVGIAGGTGTRFIGNQTAETVTLSLADTQVTGLDVSSTRDVEFSVDSVAKYVILDPTDGTVDNAVTVTVQAQDQFGNLVVTENRDVTLAATGSASGAGVVNIQNGVGSLAISDQQAETVTLSLQDSEGTGLSVSSNQDLVFAAGVATKYVILDPADSNVGLAVVVTVRTLDQYDNHATTENRDVTLAASGSATGGGLVNVANGIGTIAINDLVAETVTLTLVDTQTTGLDVTSTQDVVFLP